MRVDTSKYLFIQHVLVGHIVQSDTLLGVCSKIASKKRPFLFSWSLYSNPENPTNNIPDGVMPRKLQQRESDKKKKVFW